MKCWAMCGFVRYGNGIKSRPLLIGNRNDMYKQIFTLSDGNRLAKSGGSFPYTKELVQGEEMSFEIACTGQGESGGEDDIVVTGTFLQDVEWRNVGNGHFSSSEEYICSLDADENPKYLNVWN